MSCEPHVIRRTALYTLDSAAKATGLPRRALGNAIRARELEASLRARRHLILGQWLLDWIEAGRLSQRRKQLKDDAGTRVAA
jgi:hypothetical protein